ncbi:hypothetical protein VDR86_20160 [Xanthomonas campestris pv. campestris]|uniref:hypothetical protein n=1 Tax=Xanthomonas campestris TaxID=339 RepID=UPI0025A07B51|nr:hypothetical protein [Xanthomonas campestris]MDM7706247.1 hypothetical protein [Xanthomonas campestris pv. campestris]MDM7880952.1 hypothetical protein [Xanthomonas campestris pv. campestris]MDO0860865.1 hypothetical protein [Xanthomonas campestris pv. campestris]MEB1935936.1 hypothetical protein [Xanthomonas campestris pv. campestris]MEB1948467.1 hypothetical protein [Xanthomonas campestris pv. campestris]
MLARPAREFAGAFKLSIARGFVCLCSETAMIYPSRGARILQVRIDDHSNVFANLPQRSCAAALSRIKLSAGALP